MRIHICDNDAKAVREEAARQGRPVADVLREMMIVGLWFEREVQSGDLTLLVERNGTLYEFVEVEPDEVSGRGSRARSGLSAAPRRLQQHATGLGRRLFAGRARPEPSSSPR